MNAVIDDILSDARMLARLGRWDEAIATLQGATEAGVDDSRLGRLHGAILIAIGRFAEAAGILLALAARAPTDPDIAREAADCLWVLDRHDEAARLLGRVPSLMAAEGLPLRLGRVLVALGRSEEALPYLRRAHASAGAGASYGEEWRWLVQASLSNAAECRRLLAEADPRTCDNATSAQEIAAFANDLGELMLAEAWCRQALSLDASYGPAWFLLGIVLSRLQKKQDAAEALFQASRHLPHVDAILLAAVGAAIEADRLVEARSLCERLAGKANASHEDLLIAGLAFWRLDEVDRSLALFARSSDLGPADGAVEDAAIGQLYETIAAEKLVDLIERLREKAKSNAAAFRRFAYRSLYLADWRDREAMAKRYGDALGSWIDAGEADCNMLWTLAGLGLDYRADLRVCRPIAARYRGDNVPMPARAGRDKIRVGWLQVATGFHSTMIATRNLVERADRKRFEVYGYARRDQAFDESHGNFGFQKGLRGAFDTFRDLTSMDGTTAAAIMRADDLDVVIELQGLNENNSMDVMAHRPARVSAVYYGFSHSTGADYIDYLMADRVFMPPDLARIGTEKIVYLPGCHMAPTLGDFDQRPVQRAALGLPENAIVLCNFNNPWKHDPLSFRSWMRILAAVPEAVLWLASWNDTATRNLSRAAREAGIDPKRLIYGPVASHPIHLARLQVADLALNSFYVGGGVTSLDTLWAGVPMVATRGLADAPSGYLGASMLEAAGLGELVTNSPGEYEALVIALCRDPARLARLRDHLIKGRKTLPLFDIDGAARHIDRACELMFENWAAGRAPRDLDVEPRWSAWTG